MTSELPDDVLSARFMKGSSSEAWSWKETSIFSLSFMSPVSSYAGCCCSS